MPDTAHTIDRARFERIVAEAAKEAELPPNDVRKLLSVAASARRVAFGENVVKRCGCPLVKAGFRERRRTGSWSRDRGRFAWIYDKAIRSAVASLPLEGIVEVID